MSTFKVPNRDKQIIQSNVGDYRGNVWATYNVDLDSNPGTIKVSKRLTRVLDTAAANWEDNDIVQALQVHDGLYYVATDDAVFGCAVTADPTDSGNWGEVGNILVEDLGNETDMTSFTGLLLVSLGTDILSWNGAVKNNDWWTTVALGSALTAGKVHTMEVLRTGVDTLFITNGNEIRYYNSDAGATIISLDTLMTSNSLTPTLDRMWVGSYTEVENNAYIYEVQVGNDQATQAYRIDGRVCLTSFAYNNTPFVITEKGYIQAFNGAEFVTVSQFPWADQSKVMKGCRPGQVSDSPHLLAIHPKGSKVSGKYAFIYVNSDDEYDAGTNLSPRGSAGVWVLDLETYSLTHRYALNGDSSDYGSSKTEYCGPLLLTNTPETRIMVGGSVDGTKGVWMENPVINQGYFVTTRHESDSVADAFETVVVKTDTLDIGESVVTKYKDETRPNFPLEALDVSWLNSTQFTTTNYLEGVVEATEAVFGDEVEIISGVGAGQMAHIVSIEGTTTKTVTLDADMGTVLNDLSDIRIESFKTITPNEERSGEFEKLGAVNGVTPARQYKVVMKGNVTLRELASKSNAKNEL